MNGRALLSAVVAFASCVALLPVVSHLCWRWRALDLPGPLKIHSRPVPRLGGVAVIIAIFAGMAASAPISAGRDWPCLAAFALIWGVGLVDDLRSISPAFRLAAQFVAALGLWLSGLRIPGVGGFLGYVAVSLVVVAFTNSLNFLDGADGIAAGTSAISAVAFAILPGMSRDAFAICFSLALLGASAGFLTSNFPPAKIFCGDSGSTLLGFGMAFLALRSYRIESANPTAAEILFPILVAALPLSDAALAIIRRLRANDSPLLGDLSHFADLLRARGLSPRQVAFASYGIAAIFAAVAWLSVKEESWQALLVSALCLAALIAVSIRLGSLQGGVRKPLAARPMRVEANEKNFGRIA